MADIEKVIKALEHCKADACGSDCPYKGAIDCIELMCSDALDLMKEQETVEPITDSARNRRCPKCNTILKGKFCHECGQAVKWE